MTTIMPQSELVRRAAAYVAAGLAEKGRDAAMRFSLTPLDRQALERLFATPSGEHPAMPSPMGD